MRSTVRKSCLLPPTSHVVCAPLGTRAGEPLRRPHKSIRPRAPISCRLDVLCHGHAPRRGHSHASPISMHASTPTGPRPLACTKADEPNKHSGCSFYKGMSHSVTSRPQRKRYTIRISAAGSTPASATGPLSQHHTYSSGGCSDSGDVEQREYVPTPYRLATYERRPALPCATHKSRSHCVEAHANAFTVD